MSILLNALNKHKDNSEQDEIDQLIDNPIEETEEEERTSHMPYLVVGLLAAIIFLLIVIIVLLIREPSQIQTPVVSTSEQSVQQNKLVDEKSSTADSIVTKSSQSAGAQNDLVPGTTEKAITENRVNQKRVTQDTETFVGETSAVETNISDNASKQTQEEASSSRFIEQYQPKKYSSEDLTSSVLATQKESRTADDNSSQMATEEDQKGTREFSSEQGITSDREYNSYSSGDMDMSLPVLEKTQLTEIQLLMVNEVNIGAHIYSEDPSQRFVFVDGEMKVEGEKLVNSWYLERIEPDGVIINNNILRVRLYQ